MAAASGVLSSHLRLACNLPVSGPAVEPSARSSPAESFFCAGHDLAMSKHPNPIDVHVGSRMRMRRMMLGLSQQKLADAFGVSFQQVQKYEKGDNRMGSSRLQQAANVLGRA